jgi:hypothetical protein
MSISPASFRDALTIPTGRGPARLAEVMAPFQAADFTALDRGFVALAKGERPDLGRYWLERTKGASKDTDVAVMVLWLLLFGRPGLTIQVAAADFDEADELRKTAKDIIRLNEWLSQSLEVRSTEIRNRRTESACTIIAADVAGSHGARPDLLVVNEITHIAKEEFVKNLLDNASKLVNGVVVVATNAGFVGTWQEVLRNVARASKRWHFSQYTEQAPWLDAQEIAEARARNSPRRFSRLWEGEWIAADDDGCPACADRRGMSVLLTPGEIAPEPCQQCGEVPEQILYVTVEESAPRTEDATAVSVPATAGSKPSPVAKRGDDRIEEDYNYMDEVNAGFHRARTASIWELLRWYSCGSTFSKFSSGCAKHLLPK